MGLEDKSLPRIQRSSERLLSRNLSLHLGYTPAPDKVTAINQYNIKQHLSNVPSALKPYSLAIHEDINIQRENLTDNFNTPVMADETRFSEIENNVDTLKDDVSSLKTDVEGISDKMDKLIEAMTRLDPNPATAPDNTLQNAPGHVTTTPPAIVYAPVGGPNRNSAPRGLQSERAGC